MVLYTHSNNSCSQKTCQWSLPLLCSQIVLLLASGIVMLLIISIIALASLTLHWKLIGDPPIYHYIGWLMTKGYVPYRDIFDYCLFGTYAVHFFVVKFIGQGDLAWRLFDLTCLGLIDLAIFLYCLRFGNLAAIAAAALFSAIHLYNGPLCAGQKDYILLVFLIWGIYFFQKYREDGLSLVYFMISGLLFGAGITIKPFVAFWCAFFLLLSFAFDHRQQQYRFSHYTLYSICCSLPVLTGLSLLWRADGLQPFLDILFNYIGPLYPKMQLYNIYPLLREPLLCIPIGVLLAIIFTVGVADIALSKKKDVYRIILVCGIIYGVFHYALQRKGLLYHLYPFFLFAAMLVASWFEYGQRRLTSPRLIMLCVALLITGTFLFGSARNIFIKPPHYFEHFPYEDILLRDLTGRVPDNETLQSMDVMSGTINICLRLHILKPTRFINDAFFYFEYTHPYVQGLRKEFLNDLRKKRPLFITMSRGGFPIEGFDRIKLFPELDQFLRENYILDRERERYRIYKRKNA